MLRKKALIPQLMDLGEMETEHRYLTKRLYRLDKLQALGKQVEPDLQTVLEREDVLDIAIRERLRGMAEIPG